jgi:hypothetical protein
MLASLPNTKLATIPFHQMLAFLALSFLTKLEPLPIPRPTDVLDGMSGFACLTVYISHCVPLFFPNGRVRF